jgi:hypothetical protein
MEQAKVVRAGGTSTCRIISSIDTPQIKLENSRDLLNRKSKYRWSPWMTHEGTSSDQVLAILKRVLRTE